MALLAQAIVSYLLITVLVKYIKWAIVGHHHLLVAALDYLPVLDC
jgi:hypothetical protein